MFKRKRAKYPDTKLKFRTTEQEQNNRRRLGWSIFIVILVLLLLASTAVILKQTGVTEKMGKQKLETGSTNMKEKVNIMIGGSSEDGKLLFIGRLNINTSSGEMKVKMYNPATVYKGKSYAQMYQGDAASADALARAFGKSIGETMDRYAVVNEISASSVGFDLGFTTVKIPKSINYTTSKWSVKLEKGEQDLGGSDMFNYIRYYGLSKNSSGYRNQAKLIAAVVEQALNKDNAANGQQIFESLSDDMQTNLGISDYANYAPFIEGISKISHKVEVG